MNALSPLPRFPGWTRDDDRRASTAELPDALYAHQRAAEASLQTLSDELSFVLWADGRTDAGQSDVSAMRIEAEAMAIALSAYRSAKASLQAIGRALDAGRS